jgi:hypothetical protein
MVATSVTLSTAMMTILAQMIVVILPQVVPTKNWKSEPNVANSHFATVMVCAKNVSLIVTKRSVATMDVADHVGSVLQIVPAFNLSVLVGFVNSYRSPIRSAMTVTIAHSGTIAFRESAFQRDL